MLGQSSEQKFLNIVQKKHARAELRVTAFRAKIPGKDSERRQWGRVQSAGGCGVQSNCGGRKEVLCCFWNPTGPR